MLRSNVEDSPATFLRTKVASDKCYLQGQASDQPICGHRFFPHIRISGAVGLKRRFYSRLLFTVHDFSGLSLPRELIARVELRQRRSVAHPCADGQRYISFLQQPAEVP